MSFPLAGPRLAYKVPLCEFEKRTPPWNNWKKAPFPLVRCSLSQDTLQIADFTPYSSRPGFWVSHEVHTFYSDLFAVKGKI